MRHLFKCCLYYFGCFQGISNNLYSSCLIREKWLAISILLRNLIRFDWLVFWPLDTLGCLANVLCLLIFELFFNSSNVYLNPLLIYYCKYCFIHQHWNWWSQYKHSNSEISVIKYEKNMQEIWKKIHILII